MRNKIYRNDVLKRMFPHTFRLDFTYTDPNAEGDTDNPFADDGGEVTKTIVDGYPCSIQHATTSEKKTTGGYVLSDQYIMLCPVLPFPEGLPIDGSAASMTIWITIRGKEYEILSGQIKGMDTTDCFELGGYKMGTKITIQGDFNLFI